MNEPENPGTGKSSATTGTDADSSSTGNGQDHAAAGNGRDPWTDVDGAFADDDTLPTEDGVKVKPSSVYAPAKLRALAKQRDANLEEYTDLVGALVISASNILVTRAKIDAAVTEQARKDRQELKAAAAATGEDDDESRSIADQLVRQFVALVDAGQAIVGRTEDGTGYARCPVDHDSKTILATYPINALPFRNWLRRRYYAETKKSLRRDALDQAVSTIAAIAEFGGEKIDRLFVRVAASDGKHYLDLGTPDWSAVEIGPSLGAGGCGWQVVATPPVWFTRSITTKPLPIPVPGGSINELRPFLNLAKVGNDDDDSKDDDFVLAVAHRLGALNPDGPFGILCLLGTWSSAKSTALSVLRRLIDPNLADRRAPPATVLDLMRNAGRTWDQSFDNVGGFRQEMCDALCRLATGGGDVVRRLFTDDGEITFESCRPVMLTSVMDAVTRPDLLSRSLVVNLPFLEKGKVKTEKQFWREFDTAHPRVLGVLLSAVAHGLAQPSVDRSDLPRLADFAAWVTRCEGGLGWVPGTCIAAINRNAADIAQDALDNDPLAGALRDMLERTQAGPDGSVVWEGQVSELQQKIRNEIGEYAYRAAQLPRLPHHFSGRLRQLAPLLTRAGVTLTRGRSKKGGIVFLGTTQKTSRVRPSIKNLASPGTDASPVEKISMFSSTNGNSDDGKSGKNGKSASPLSVTPPQNVGDAPASPTARSAAPVTLNDADFAPASPKKPQKTVKSDAGDANGSPSLLQTKIKKMDEFSGGAGPAAEELL
jgi:hypothetical protein